MHVGLMERQIRMKDRTELLGQLVPFCCGMKQSLSAPAVQEGTPKLCSLGSGWHILGVKAGAELRVHGEAICFAQRSQKQAAGRGPVVHSVSTKLF